MYLVRVMYIVSAVYHQIPRIYVIGLENLEFFFLAMIANICHLSILAKGPLTLLPMRFHHLPLDLSISILEFLDFAGLIVCKLVSRNLYTTITKHPMFYKLLLLNDISGYYPLQYPAAEFCEEKVRRWTKKEFHWYVIGNTTRCR